MEASGAKDTSANLLINELCQQHKLELGGCKRGLRLSTKNCVHCVITVALEYDDNFVSR